MNVNPVRSDGRREQTQAVARCHDYPLETAGNLEIVKDVKLRKAVKRHEQRWAATKSNKSHKKPRITVKIRKS